MAQTPHAAEPAAPDEGEVESFWSLACHRATSTPDPWSRRRRSTSWRFSEVGEDHARDEGEGEGDLARWRRVHADLLAGSAGGFEPDMPVVLERFRLVFGQ